MGWFRAEIIQYPAGFCKSAAGKKLSLEKPHCLGHNKQESTLFSEKMREETA
jgi:hypothetical protein